MQDLYNIREEPISLNQNGKRDRIDEGKGVSDWKSH